MPPKATRRGKQAVQRQIHQQLTDDEPYDDDPWGLADHYKSEWDDNCEWDFGFDCACTRCRGDVRPGMRCKCPYEVRADGDGMKYHATVGHSDACRIHIKPGCPECRETWIEVFRWPTCGACGWRAPAIEELP